MKAGEWIAKHKYLILGLSIILLIPSMVGIARTRINYDLLSYLPKSLETVEEIGRYGCFVFMIFMESGMLNIFGSGRQEEKLILLISGLAVAIMVLLSGSFLLLWGKKMR